MPYTIVDEGQDVAKDIESKTEAIDAATDYLTKLHKNGVVAFGSNTEVCINDQATDKTVARVEMKVSLTVSDPDAKSPAEDFSTALDYIRDLANALIAAAGYKGCGYDATSAREFYCKHRPQPEDGTW